MLIFINYKRNVNPDHQLARRLERSLASLGYETFRDESGIEIGEEWALRIYDQVEQCDVMVSLISNASLESSWVLNEIDLAIRFGKHRVPVKLEKLDPSLEFRAYNPRFMQILSYEVRGDTRRALQVILDAIEVWRTSRSSS